MKTRWSRSLLGFIALVVVCVHLSHGSTIPRKKTETKEEASETKPVKKFQLHKKYKSPIVLERKKNPKNKLKISDLRPCISKAFCEVNSITEEPTYETSKEFYLILNRFKKFIDNGERDDNGSGSVEEDGSSSEESNEHVPYMPEGPHRSSPQGSYFRRGKSVEPKLKKKNDKLAKLNKSTNDTSPVDSTLAFSAPSNSTKPPKVYTPAQIEQRAFVSRKTLELDVVDDLAALIKISAEIGQALRSPRKCRSLFKKCAMNYDQIIRIFNRTQSVESSDGRVPSPSPPTKHTHIEPIADLSVTISPEDPLSLSPSPAEPTKVVAELEETDNISDSEGNRNKKSRTDFSDEDLEYITDSEAESQPVKTYSLFASPQTEQTKSDDTNKRERDEAIVDEAFQKFEKVFPSTGSSNKPKYQQSESTSSKVVVRQPYVTPSSSEEEGSNESVSSGSAEIHNNKNSDYQHRSAEVENNNDSEEVEMEVPDKKVKTKHNTQSVKENSEIAGEVDETEDDSDAEIPSSEIGKKPENDGGEVVKVPGGEADSSEEGSEEEFRPAKSKVKGQNDLLPEREQLYTRDEENNDGGFNSYGFYPQVRPMFTKPVQQAVKSKEKKKKKNKKGDKAKEPQDDQNSSEEDQPDPERDRPPPGSEFYQVMKQVNGGKGADAIPEKSYNKKSKRKPDGGNEPEQYQDYHGQSGYGGSSYGHNKPNNGGYGHGGEAEYTGVGGYGVEGPQSDDQGSAPPSFFQSIMGWFSRGSKSASGPDETTGQYPGGPGSYYGGGNKEPSNYQQPYGKPYGKYSEGGHGSLSEDIVAYPPSRRPQPYGGDSDRYPSSNGGKPTGGRYPPLRPQGRGDESSEEEEEEEEDDEVKPIQREIQHKRRRPSQPIIKSQDSSSSVSVSGPPPPLVILPQGEEADFPINYNKRNPENNNKQQQQRQKPQRKPEKDHSDEESKETSSEEVQEKKSPPKKSQSSKKTPKPSINPDNEKVFSGIFASAAEIDKQIVRDKVNDDRENANLLQNTFDLIQNSFTTSADKVTDWSEEDNPRSKINVESLASNGPQTQGKYKVNRNRNRNKNKNAGQQQVSSFEVEDKNEQASSEEEEDKK